MYKYLFIITIIIIIWLHNLHCIEGEKDLTKKLYCTIIKIAFQKLDEIRKLAMLFIKWEKKDHMNEAALDLKIFPRLVKRQYSAYTLINTVQKGMCTKSPNPFIYGVFCCIFHVLE